MKRNGKNLKMPHVKGMTSDKWSTMTNLERYDFLRTVKSDEKTLRLAKKEAKKNQVEVVEEVK